jgi:hypothetical protein
MQEFIEFQQKLLVDEVEVFVELLRVFGVSVDRELTLFLVSFSILHDLSLFQRLSGVYGLLLCICSFLLTNLFEQRVWRLPRLNEMRRV